MPKTSPPLRELLAEYGDVPVCGRCLVVVNVTDEIRAKSRAYAEVFSQPTNMLALKAWVIVKILERGWWFEIGDTSERFMPLSTYRGDPVCAYHLYELVRLEELISRR